MSGDPRELEDTWAEAFRIPGPRATVHSLHGPMAEGRPLWPQPYTFAVGSRAFEAEATRLGEGAATERWEHGLLVEVADGARLDALAQQWGPTRTAAARVGAVAALPASEEDRGAIARFVARGWLRPLVRALEHVGCKSAWLGRAVPGALGEAVEAARRRPRLAVLDDLLSRGTQTPRQLWVALERADRQLDQASGGQSWLMSQVPEHCTALWPLRNLMRRADRDGLLFAEMRFSAYESLDAFVPELPLVCLDREIYGGGFDHDLFHRLCPVPRSGDRTDDELGLLAIEAMAQAFNGLVLDSRHEGPAYDGHASWQGHTLFEALERGFELPTLTQQLAAFRVLALVGHPALGLDPHTIWPALLPGPAPAALIDSLTSRYARYVRLDQGWLLGLHARYETALFERWRPVLADRLSGSLADVLRASDALVHEAEDLDLRRVDVGAAGAAAHHKEELRQLVLKELELLHLCEEAAHLEAATVAGLAASHQALMAQCGALAEQAWASGQGRRAGSSEAGLSERAATLGSAVIHARGVLSHTVEGLRRAQAAGELEGPAIGADFVENPRELFHGVYYTPPAHIGADGPGAPP